MPFWALQNLATLISIRISFSPLCSVVYSPPPSLQRRMRPETGSFRFFIFVLSSYWKASTQISNYQQQLAGLTTPSTSHHFLDDTCLCYSKCQQFKLFVFSPVSQKKLFFVLVFAPVHQNINSTMANIYFLSLVSTMESSNSEECLAYSRHTIIFIEGVMKLWHFNNVNSLFRPFRDIPVSYSSVPLAMAFVVFHILADSWSLSLLSCDLQFSHFLSFWILKTLLFPPHF